MSFVFFVLGFPCGGMLARLPCSALDPTAPAAEVLASGFRRPLGFPFCAPCRRPLSAFDIHPSAASRGKGYSCHSRHSRFHHAAGVRTSLVDCFSREVAEVAESVCRKGLFSQPEATAPAPCLCVSVSLC